MSSQSLLQQSRLQYQPKLPKALQNIQDIVVAKVKRQQSESNTF